MKRKIMLGSRRSQLALIQTTSVADSMRRANPGLEIEIKQVVTSGDRDRNRWLERLGADSFVKELEEALLEGSIDIAVHSLKDLPITTPDGLRIAAVSERLNPGDVLVSGDKGLAELPPGSKIATDSPRRRAQLAAYRPDLEACRVRGNIDTRLRKLAGQEFDGIIVAAAGLIRLGYQHKITEYLPLDSFLPAAGQGALAVESRRDDKELVDMISLINHLPTWRSVTAERALLATLGGGCGLPIAVLGTVDGTAIKLEAMVASPDGHDVRRASVESETLSPPELGKLLAGKLLAMGVDKLLEGAEPR